MNKEDYSKYYIQGSDHYLIPKDIFIELFDEMENWREEAKEFKNQQKEFIEYMNKTIEELECDDVDDEEMKGYLIQRIDTFKEILSKFKSIIGGKDAIK